MEAYEFNPELHLTHDDRAQVAHTVAMPGFKIIDKIYKAEISKFIIDLINTPEGNDEVVLAKHRLSKAAALVYAGAVSRVNQEVQQYVATQGASGTPVDPTEGLIDLGEVASTRMDVTDVDEDVLS